MESRRSQLVRDWDSPGEAKWRSVQMSDIKLPALPQNTYRRRCHQQPVVRVEAPSQATRNNRRVDVPCSRRDKRRRSSEPEKPAGRFMRSAVVVPNRNPIAEVDIDFQEEFACSVIELE